jgi:hypothetical protein
MNKKKITKYIYIGLFAALYLSVALVSGIHAVAFFSLANAPALGVMLAITFEIGQAAVLFSLLTNPNQRKKIMTWVQLSIFTLVQILGNVYSSYKYIVSNSMENLKFFKEPVFIWTDLPDQMCNVIITYLVGGILPISALLLTEMLTSYLYKEENKVQEPTKQEEIKEDKKEEPEPEPEHKIENEQVQEQTNQKEETIKEDGRICERDNSRSKESEGVVNETDEGDTQNLTKEEAKPDVSEPEISKPNLKSQFLNI